MSTLYIHQPGVARLARWDLLDAVAASGCPRLDTVSYRVGDVLLTSAAARLGEISYGYGPRRYLLDQILVDGAVRAGAEFSEGCRLLGLSQEDGRVNGVVLKTGSGALRAEHALLVVGADGMESKTAELVGARETLSDPRMTCVYYSAWDGIDTGFGFYERPGIWIASIPTNHGVTLLATYFPQERFAGIRTDALGAHLAAIREAAPDLHAKLGSAERVDRLRGTGNQRNFFRQANGPGWVLVGDAGHHRDTITAQGITNALLQAEMLVSAIGDNLHDPIRLDRALAEFAQDRDNSLVESYRATLEVARLKVPRSRAMMMQAISEIPALTERYFAVVAGIMPMSEFLTQELAELL